MYKTNVPARFKTEKGSKYTITECCVRRKKFDDTLHCDYKNIFYTDQETSKAIGRDVNGKRAVGVKISINQKNKHATFRYVVKGKQKSFRLSTAAEIGKIPLDIILDIDGRPVKSHRLHRGHMIVSINKNCQ